MEAIRERKDDQKARAAGVLEAFRWMQDRMEGEAERAGLTSEESIMDLVREIRYGERTN